MLQFQFSRDPPAQEQCDLGSKGVSEACAFYITILHGSLQGMLSPDNVKIRVFLAVVMIVYRSNHVFEQMGELE